jgi:hypothetical protein
MGWNFPNMLCGQTKLQIEPTNTTVCIHMMRTTQTSTIAVPFWAQMVNGSEVNPYFLAAL